MKSLLLNEAVSGFWNELFSLIVRPRELRRVRPGSLVSRSPARERRPWLESSMLLAELGPCVVTPRGIWAVSRSYCHWSVRRSRRYSRSRSFLSLLFFSFSSFSSFLSCSSSRLLSLLLWAPSQKPMTKMSVITVPAIGMADGWSNMGCQAVVELFSMSPKPSSTVSFNELFYWLIRAASGEEISRSSVSQRRYPSMSSGP